MNIKSGVYRHYSGHLYKVIDLGNMVVGDGADEKPGEEMVVYHALFTSETFGRGHYWIRTPENFAEEVTYNGENVLRFTYVNDKE